VGRLAYQKNYDFLLKNFNRIKKEIPNAKIVIVGDGPYYERFKKEIKELEIQNDFLLAGAIKNAYRYIKAFDVFTLPSYHEGLPISLIEAVLAELPILTSDVGGNKENVGGSSEQVFILNDINDYIKKLLEIKKNRSHFIDYNASLKKDFTLDKMVSKYKALYDSLIEDYTS
jgi:glycosyltransferase involved in cell wall biosynthesis